MVPLAVSVPPETITVVGGSSDSLRISELEANVRVPPAKRRLAPSPYIK